MGSFGGMEIVIILLVVLLFFGAKRIPELARGIGQGMNEFRKASDEIKKELEEGKTEGLGSKKKKKPVENKEPKESNKKVVKENQNK